MREQGSRMRVLWWFGEFAGIFWRSGAVVKTELSEWWYVLKSRPRPLKLAREAKYALENKEMWWGLAARWCFGFGEVGSLCWWQKPLLLYYC